MPFAATWMELEIVILSEKKSDRGGDKLHEIPHTCNLRRHDTNKLIKQKRDSQT